MRGRVVGAFVVGFAIGALCVGAALWSTGTLHTAYMPPWKRPPAVAPATSGVPNTNASAQVPGPPVPPPETPPGSPTGSVAGSADRSADRAAPDAGTVRPAADLHLAMPIANVDPSTLHSNFEDARAGHKHEALDIMAPRGTPVMAVAEGNVAKLFNSKDGGLTVYQFDNTQKYAFYYAHLDRYAPNLKEGMLLRKGDTLGFVGTTGDAPPNAPHLHFSVFMLGPEKNWWKGTAIDPLPLFR